MLTPIYDALYANDPKSVPIPASVFYAKDGFSVGEFSVDLILSEHHALVSTVSLHPVEEGAAIADHIRQELRGGSLNALVSNHSLNLSGDYSVAEAGDSQKMPNYGTSTRTRTANPAKDMWENLKALWENREPVTIVTTLEVYENVVITHAATSRAEDSGEALEFEIQFTQIRTVKLQEVQITASVAPLTMKTDTDKKAAVKKNKGKEVAKPVPAGTGAHSAYIQNTAAHGVAYAQPAAPDPFAGQSFVSGNFLTGGF